MTAATLFLWDASYATPAGRLQRDAGAIHATTMDTARASLLADFAKRGRTRIDLRIVTPQR